MNGSIDALAGRPGALAGDLAWLGSLLEWASLAIDMAAIAVMLVGAARFIVGFVRAEASGAPLTRLRGIDGQRIALGRYILAALELLIVSDIIHTALSLSLEDLLPLGLLVLIRSLISFFLDRELREAAPEDRPGAGSGGGM